MRLKFKVNDLIGVVTQRREQVVKDHKRDMVRYERQVQKVRPVVVARLRALADEIADQTDAAAFPALRTHWDGDKPQVIVEVVVPGIKSFSRPRLNTSSLDYALSALGATQSETITLSPEEYAWYMPEEAS